MGRLNFVARATRESGASQREEEESRGLMEKRFDELDRKLDALGREAGST